MLFIVVAGGVGYLAYSVAMKPQVAIKHEAKKPVVTVVPEPRKVVIYVPAIAGNSPYLKAQDRTTELKGGILDAAIETLLATAGEDGMVGQLIPRGTRLLAPVAVEKRVATVNLSREFTENFSGGSTREALTLNAIAHTLVENSDGDVRKVQILVEGKKADTLGGHFEIAEPISADSAMLKPGS